jgi:hypothetical protein
MQEKTRLGAGIGPPLIGLLLVVAALAALSATPAFAKAGPLEGNGSWIWYVSASGGSPAALARQADRRGLDTVYVKSSDGSDYWSQFSRKLVTKLHRRGLSVCAWPFVYGQDPGREAALSARAAERGADCLVIDAESSYEGRYEQAYRYIHKLRRLVGRNYPVGLSSFPYADYHPTLPYSVFLGSGGAQYNLPQIYWRAIGDPLRAAFIHTYRWNRAYDRPIFPLGQTWQNPPKRQILDFRRYAAEFGADGVSWWSWQETNSREWRLITRRLKRGIPGFDASRTYADLRRGDTGDLVLFAQELLRAWRIKVAPDGAFGRKMKRAVKRFQSARGLEASGRVGDATWRALGKRQPKSTNWKRVKTPTVLSRGPRRDPLPASRPGEPGFRGERPPTLGRP